MQVRRLSCALAGTLAGIGLAGAALAHDLNPPSYRGMPLSTAAEWDFNTNQPPVSIQPDGADVALVIGDMAPALNGAFPGSAPHPSCSKFGDVAWMALGNQQGYLSGPLGNGGVACNVPNWIDTEPEKRLRVQVTYIGAAPSTVVFGFLGVPGSSAMVSEVFVQRVPDGGGLPSGNLYFYDDWRLFPNPDWEQVVVYLPAGTFLNQLVIDTISGPLSDDVPIFADGFETGDTSRWSETTP